MYSAKKVGMDTRKLQVVGNRSFALSLPKRWVLKHRLKAGASLFIQETANADLVIKANPTTPIETKELTVSIETIERLTEFIVFCYVKNVNKLTLLWKKQDLLKIKQIKQALQFLDGYDITKEDEKCLEISFLFTEVTITIQHIQRRMIYLLKLMASYIEEKDSEGIAEVESSLDKLHHLSSRILFSCIRSFSLRRENEIDTEEEIYFYRNILRRLESIGDLLYKSQKKTFGSNDILQLKEILRQKIKNLKAFLED